MASSHMSLTKIRKARDKVHAILSGFIDDEE